MIDSTRSPVPAWKRLGLIVLVAVLVIAVGYFIWTKDLHHSTSPSAGSPAATAPAPAQPAHVAHTPPTTAGLPVSGRDPFG